MLQNDKAPASQKATPSPVGCNTTAKISVQQFTKIINSNKPKNLFYESKKYLLRLSTLALLIQLILVLSLVTFVSFNIKTNEKSQVEILVNPETHDEILPPEDTPDFFEDEPTPEDAETTQETPDQEESSSSAWDSAVESLSDLNLGDNFDIKEDKQNSPLTGDSAIAKRLKKFGGRSSKLDIRITLLWNHIADLDLKVLNPLAEPIYHAQKKDSFGGVLDIDKNVSYKKLSKTPIENIIWPLHKAPSGTYTVVISCAHFQTLNRIPFKIEVQNKRKIKHYKGVMTPKDAGGLTVCTFKFKETNIYDNDTEKVVVPIIDL